MERLKWVEMGGKARPATLNLTPGTKVYGEELVQIGGKEYRVWNPFRSKLSAALIKGLRDLPLTHGSKVLYLGAGSGTTASHISDLVGPEGVVYCVEFSHRPMMELILSCKNRENMLPILADARHPEAYRFFVGEVDVIYEDVAQPDQTDILLRNAEVFLKERGFAFLALKARAIDVTADPRTIYKREAEKLGSKFKVLDILHLDPFEKDHAMFLLQYERPIMELTRISRSS